MSQKQMREWIPNAVATFRSAMPPISIQFPMIYIASKHTMEKVVAQISDSIQCDPSQITASSSTMMEFIRVQLEMRFLFVRMHSEGSLGLYIKRSIFSTICGMNMDISLHIIMKAPMAFFAI